MSKIINDNGTDRPMTSDELAHYEESATAILAEQEQTKIESETKAAARARAIKKLADLGLTKAELTALLG